MLIIQHNAQTTSVAGWRAWLLAAVAFIGATLVMGLIAFLFLGVAITVGAVLLIAVPVRSVWRSLHHCSGLNPDSEPRGLVNPRYSRPLL